MQLIVQVFLGESVAPSSCGGKSSWKGANHLCSVCVSLERGSCCSRGKFRFMPWHHASICKVCHSLVTQWRGEISGVCHCSVMLSGQQEEMTWPPRDGGAFWLTVSRVALRRRGDMCEIHYHYFYARERWPWGSDMRPMAQVVIRTTCLGE